MIQIKIPCKSYIKKYLIHRYGETHQLSLKKFIGVLICNVLDKKTNHSNKDIFSNEFYIIEVPESYFKKKGFNVGYKKKRQLSTCFELLFFEDFYRFVDFEIIKGNNAYQSVKLFLKLHDISEFDAKLESMYRNYQRYSDEKIKEKKLLYS